MGKSKPWDRYENQSSIAEIESIHIPAGENKYGYQININHPQINDLYRRYLKWKGIPQWCPLSDKERFDFESYILGLIEKENIKE